MTMDWRSSNCVVNLYIFRRIALLDQERRCNHEHHQPIDDAPMLTTPSVRTKLLRNPDCNSSFLATALLPVHAIGSLNKLVHLNLSGQCDVVYINNIQLSSAGKNKRRFQQWKQTKSTKIILTICLFIYLIWMHIYYSHR